MLSAQQIIKWTKHRTQKYDILEKNRRKSKCAQSKRKNDTRTSFGIQYYNIILYGIYKNTIQHTKCENNKANGVVMWSFSTAWKATKSMFYLKTHWNRKLNMNSYTIPTIFYTLASKLCAIIRRKEKKLHANYTLLLHNQFYLLEKHWRG